MGKKWMSILLMICLIVCTALAPAAESRAEEGSGLKIIIVDWIYGLWDLDSPAPPAGRT